MINSNRITFIPDSVYDLINLEDLICRNNEIHELSELINKLVNLTEFDCYSNKITVIPESIGYLNNLHSINICNNLITSLPPTIINLRNINIFDKDRDIPLTPEQERYFRWINSNKKDAFDEYCDVTLVKCALKCS